MDKNVCANCGKDLSTMETVYAAYGLLFCSDDCGIRFSYLDKPITDDYLCAVVETIGAMEDPEEALVKRQAAATDKWDDHMEEVRTDDIGIAMMCDMCGRPIPVGHDSYFTIEGKNFCTEGCGIFHFYWQAICAASSAVKNEVSDEDAKRIHTTVMEQWATLAKEILI